MSVYRETRNILRSCAQKIRQILFDKDYQKATVAFSFKRIYEIPINYETKTAVICIRIGNTIHDGAELGSNLTIRKPLILIDIFGISGAQVEDLKDLLVAGLKEGFNYCEYTVLGGTSEDAYYESGETSNGRIEVDKIGDTPLDFGINKSELAPHDRYRHLITLHCYKTLLESGD